MIALAFVFLGNAPMAGLDAAQLHALSTRALFEPLAAAIGGLDDVDLAALNDLFARHAVLGLSIRFVAPDDEPIGYELRVHDRGEVVTRPDNWHDLFNALVWLRFPRTKAALNRVHVEEIRSREVASGRGARRDAATQFDESGLVVVSSSPLLLEMLRARRWVELFWVRREDVIREMRFLVFGHGLYDASRAPFHGLCGRAALIGADRDIVDAPIDTQVVHVDAVLAQRFIEGDAYPHAKCFTPVPVLGIPGVIGASESRAYYEDERQFRPVRASA